LESSRQRRQGELSQLSIEVVHVEILMVAKIFAFCIINVSRTLDLQRITKTTPLLPGVILLWLKGCKWMNTSLVFGRRRIFILRWMSTFERRPEHLHLKMHEKAKIA
jgi:hypothetical protein